MISGYKNVIDNAVDLSELDIVFTSKPIIFGGLAMEYYNLRKHGHDIDFFISNEDYQVLARKYPMNKKDKWGDLGLLIGKYELWRSVFKLDYHFYSESAIEYEKYKIISFEKLFFMKTIAFENQPEIIKHTEDFKITIKYYIEKYQNKDYLENALKYTDKYLIAPDGIILNDNYY